MRSLFTNRVPTRQLHLMIYAAIGAAAHGGLAQQSAADQLLPDLIAWASDARNYIHDGYIDTDTESGKVVYRFVGALPNIGAGPLIVREETDENQMQTVYQRFLDSDDPENQELITEQVIGVFEDAAPVRPRHLWLPGIAQYKLREVIEGGGVGEVLTMNDKTSMAVVDSAAYDTTLPGAPSSRAYGNPGAAELGISIGWADVYSLGFAGQWADATGLPSGTYWLEVTVNPYGDTPDGRVVESDYSNNSTRILVDLLPGDYNDDGVVDAADYTVWRDTLGESVTFATAGADGDGDGVITSADYDVWTDHFGDVLPEPLSGAGSMGVVSEPAGVALVLAFLPIVLSQRRR